MIMDDHCIYCEVLFENMDDAVQAAECARARNIPVGLLCEACQDMPDAAIRDRIKERKLNA